MTQGVIVYNEEQLKAALDAKWEYIYLGGTLDIASIIR